MVEREKVGCRLSLYGHPIQEQVAIKSHLHWASGLPQLQGW